MGNADYLKFDGDWNALCDRCGFKFKASELKETWDNLRVCKSCWEPRHPQDFLRGFPDDSSVPWSRPDSDADTNTTDINGNSISTINAIELVDDVGFAWEYGTHHPIIEYYTALTANRQVLITAAGSPATRDRIIVYRTAGGAFTLTVQAVAGGVLKVIPASVNAAVIIEFDGTLWKLVDYYTLGL